MRRGIKPTIPFALVLTLALGLLSNSVFADFTKEITAIPGKSVQAAATWYYASCTEILGVGTYTINVAPKYGALSFTDVSGVIPGCPAGSPALTAAVADYTLTAFPAGVTSDYFQLYYELNGAVAEVLDITVVKASLSIASALPSGTAGVVYPPADLVSGGDPPYTISATGVPAGLVINTDGTVSGTPALTDSGTYQIMVSLVTDSTGVTAGPATVPITIEPVSSCPPSGARSGESASAADAATCTPPPPSACSIVATTLAHVPDTSDTARSQIGVGENVSLKLADSTQAMNYLVTWDISLGGGTLTSDTAATVLSDTPPSDFPAGEGFPTEKCSGTGSSEVRGPQACFVAPSANDFTVITATLADGRQTSCSTQLTTVQPQGLLFQRMKTPNANNYKFDYYNFGFNYEVEMESVIFVQPADVSFANVLFQEYDNQPHVGRRYNARFNVRGTNAWLINCDYDDIPRAVILGNPAHASDTPFAFSTYQDGVMSPETLFSEVRTTWSLTRNDLRPKEAGDVHYSKWQTDEIAPDGSLKRTPGALRSELNERAVPFDGFVPVLDGKSCLNRVGAQFNAGP